MATAICVAPGLKIDVSHVFLYLIFPYIPCTFLIPISQIRKLRLWQAMFSTRSHSEWQSQKMNPVFWFKALAYSACVITPRRPHYLPLLSPQMPLEKQFTGQVLLCPNCNVNIQLPLSTIYIHTVCREPACKLISAFPTPQSIQWNTSSQY